MKKICLTIMSMLLMCTCAIAKDITLTTPITKPYYADTVRLDYVGWHPMRGDCDVYVDLGYYDDSGSWMKTGTYRNLLVNDAASTTDSYDNFITLVNSADLSIDSLDDLIMTNLILPIYPGTLE